MLSRRKERILRRGPTFFEFLLVALFGVKGTVCVGDTKKKLKPGSFQEARQVAVENVDKLGIQYTNIKHKLNINNIEFGNILWLIYDLRRYLKRIVYESLRRNGNITKHEFKRFMKLFGISPYYVDKIFCGTYLQERVSSHTTSQVGESLLTHKIYSFQDFINCICIIEIISGVQIDLIQGKAINIDGCPSYSHHIPPRPPRGKGNGNNLHVVTDGIKHIYHQRFWKFKVLIDQLKRDIDRLSACSIRWNGGNGDERKHMLNLESKCENKILFIHGDYLYMVTILRAGPIMQPRNWKCVKRVKLDEGDKNKFRKLKMPRPTLEDILKVYGMELLLERIKSMKIINKRELPSISYNQYQYNIKDPNDPFKWISKAFVFPDKFPLGPKSHDRRFQFLGPMSYDWHPEDFVYPQDDSVLPPGDLDSMDANNNVKLCKGEKLEQVFMDSEPPSTYLENIAEESEE